MEKLESHLENIFFLKELALFLPLFGDIVIGTERI